MYHTCMYTYRMRQRFCPLSPILRSLADRTNMLFIMSELKVHTSRPVYCSSVYQQRHLVDTDIPCSLPHKLDNGGAFRIKSRDAEPEPPEQTHFGRSRSRRNGLLGAGAGTRAGAGAGAGAVKNSGSGSEKGYNCSKKKKRRNNQKQPSKQFA